MAKSANAICATSSKKAKSRSFCLTGEAHDLHSTTLTGLKRLIEMVEDGEGTLSIVLAGHPKLKDVGMFNRLSSRRKTD